jgi:hypothetical protein
MHQRLSMRQITMVTMMTILQVWSLKDAKGGDGDERAGERIASEGARRFIMIKGAEEKGEDSGKAKAKAKRTGRGLLDDDRDGDDDQGPLRTSGWWDQPLEDKGKEKMSAGSVSSGSGSVGKKRRRLVTGRGNDSDSDDDLLLGPKDGTPTGGPPKAKVTRRVIAVEDDEEEEQNGPGAEAGAGQSEALRSSPVEGENPFHW